MKRRTFVGSTMAAVTAIPGRSDQFAGIWRAVTQDPRDLEAVRGDGTKVALKGAAIKELGRSLHGHLLLAQSDGYELARQVLNPSINKRPALIAQPGGVDEVRSAVAFAKEYGLLVAVKCGGHSFSGQSTCDGGLMIDLSRLRTVTVNPKAKRVTVAGGSLLGQVDRASAPHGLVTTLGTVSHTGVGGLTTGGGFGRVARRFGLALDNVRAVEVVTADGKLLRANATENPDLYWGVRGGGGNFGIVTSFEFELHPMQRQVIAGNIVFPFAKAEDLWAFYGDYTVEAPDDLYLGITTGIPPGGGDPYAILEVCYSGPESGGAKAFDPLKRMGTPLADGRKMMDYVAAQSVGDQTDPRALSMYLKSGFTRQVDGKLAALAIKGLAGHPARLTQVFAAQAGGAISRVAQGATAFAHRDAQQTVMMAVGWKPGTDPTPHLDYARRYWKTLEPFTRGFYGNDLGDEKATEVDANYRENLGRLVTVKKKYDPTNLFRLNANVRPG